MKKVVITGATSFIGVHLINRWLKTDCEITAVVRPDSKNLPRLPENNQIRIVTLEMGDYDRLPDFVEKADYFYHLAWEGSRRPLRDDKALQQRNFECSVKAMDAAVNMGCSLFLGVGSQAEYGDQGQSADESFPCNPVSEYGKQKLNTMNTLSEMAKESGINFIWVRMFSLYGRYDYSESLISTCIRNMRHGNEVNLTEAKQLWDYLYVEDAAEAMIKFSRVRCENGVYNLANGSVRPLKDYVLDIKKVLNSDSEINFGAVPYPAVGPINLQPDVSKARKALDWKAGTQFTEGIARTIGLR